MWLEIPRALAWLDQDEDVRAVVLCAAGKNFCAGIDVSSPELLGEQLGQTTRSARVESCAGREAEAMYRHVRRLQESFTAVERCRAPVVCAVQGACFGGGVDLAAACDVRVCARDAVLCVTEVDLAIVADIGTLLGLPALVGHGRALEMALTARPVRAEEALSVGLVTSVRESVAELQTYARALAETLASKSPLAAQGTKAACLHARDHSVREGLEFVAHLNAARLRSADLTEATRARFERRAPRFASCEPRRAFVWKNVVLPYARNARNDTSLVIARLHIYYGLFGS